MLICICFSNFSLRIVEAKKKYDTKVKPKKKKGDTKVSPTLVANCCFYSLKGENQYFSPFSKSFSLISINASPYDSSKLPMMCYLCEADPWDWLLSSLKVQKFDLGQT